MSGVQVADDVKALYDKMRLVRTGSDQTQRERIVILNIVDGVIVATDIIRQCNLDDSRDDPYEILLSRLHPQECCYVLYDCHYEKCDTYREDIICVMWAPDNANVKKKMCYASSRNALSKAFTGIKYDLQVNDIAEINTRKCFAAFLGLDAQMTKLECRCMD